MVDPIAAPAASMAQRKRQLVRDELADAAVKLLAWQGFEATTVEQIVAAAGVSRRTFFRYFRSKEDVIVQVLADTGAELCAELSMRPPGEPPAAALRHALSGFVRHADEHAEKTRRLTGLMLQTPALLARFLERQAQWQADMAGLLAQRTGLDPARDLYPGVAAGIALTAFQCALRRWADGDGSEDLTALVDQAFALVAPALDAVPGAPRT